MNRKRTHNEIKSDSKIHLSALAELPPSEKALDSFKRPAYNIAPRKMRHRMTLAELVDIIFKLIASQAYNMSDPVPDEIVQAIRGSNENVTEYLARKYKIGGDTGGQGNT